MLLHTSSCIYVRKKLQKKWTSTVCVVHGLQRRQIAEAMGGEAAEGQPLQENGCDLKRLRPLGPLRLRAPPGGTRLALLL